MILRNSYSRVCKRTILHTRRFTQSFLAGSESPKKETPPPHENGLYFGKFTKEEYEEAKKVIEDQISKLEGQIKGDYNIRENIGKMAQFPEPSDKTSSPTKINNLTDLFTQTIKLTGPLPLSAYMRQCLTHPEFGYYTTRDPLSLRTGDFITSPEISSVFGEMIGIWYFSIWQQQNFPKSIRFIEFGPGKGTLIFDVLQTFNRFVEKVAKEKPEIEIALIEASKVLRQEQWKLLCNQDQPLETTDEGYNQSVTKWGNKIMWLDTEKDIKHDDDIANFIIAHEFFDALPIKGFIREEKGWRELMVEHTPSVNNTQPKLESKDTPEEGDESLNTEFHLTIAPKETPSSMIPQISKRYRNLPVGTRIEICPDAELYIMKMVQLLNDSNKGAILVIDYGTANEIPSNSLRGIHQHKFVSPFWNPGEVDLSIDVDFENLKLLADNVVQSYGPIPQGDWLHNIGIGYRVDQLLKMNSEAPHRQDKIYGAYRRLTDKDQMGNVYKFLALLPKGSPTPSGF
ncbi:NADH dehydrogenase [ubiquinone] complex I, assembly factor 7 [Candida viswanathii]|uniref:Protein arginine methyltransferase NDUFAF7 n=1 Tax=Candida viswanathii TaxID=5486 RepID=A0A367YAZ9_9ASCO|nr:NADH dehydrogenase [ubiquinone] complex I, assembly factor 7 [Candida viswanathii]